jgi:hypothetical protein
MATKTSRTHLSDMKYNSMVNVAKVAVGLNPAQQPRSSANLAALTPQGAAQ